MNKFEWLCQKSGLEDNIQTRCVVFFLLQPSNLYDIYKRHCRKFEKYFKSGEIEESLIISIHESIQLFDETYMIFGAAVYFLAEASFYDEQIYNDLWNVCVMLDKKARRLWKRNKSHKKIYLNEPEEFTTALSKVLSSNLIRTDIVSKSIEDCEKFLETKSEDYLNVAEKYEVIQEADYDKFNIKLVTVEFLSKMFFFGSMMIALEAHHRILAEEEYSLCKNKEIDAKKELTNVTRTLGKKTAQCSELERQIEVLYAKLEDMEKPYKERVSSLKRDLEEKNNVITLHTEKISTLEKQNAELKERIEDLEHKENYYKFIEEIISSEDTEEEFDENKDCSIEDASKILSGYRIVIFGGHSRWRNNLLVYAEEFGFNIKLAENFKLKRQSNDLFIFNICSQGHHAYYGFIKNYGSNVAALFTNSKGLSSIHLTLLKSLQCTSSSSSRRK